MKYALLTTVIKPQHFIYDNKHAQYFVRQTPHILSAEIRHCFHRRNSLPNRFTTNKTFKFQFNLQLTQKSGAINHLHRYLRRLLIWPADSISDVIHDNWVQDNTGSGSGVTAWGVSQGGVGVVVVAAFGFLRGGSETFGIQSLRMRCFTTR